MKRKKKAGGYNLRKCLAWDRAFFTDEGIFLFSFSFFFFAFLLVLLLLEKKEFNFSLMYFFLVLGVLNSTELSLISGNIDKSSGEKLLVIEEEIESLSGDSQDLQALENNLFKELSYPTLTTFSRNSVSIFKHRLLSSPHYKMNFVVFLFGNRK